MKKSAFTLIELLVVIAIIAVLAGIALPVFTAANEKGKVTKDANNLHQIGIAFVAYTTDNADSIFNSGSSAWVQQVNPKYVQSWKVFQSPFDTDPTRTPSESGTSAPVSPISYATNDNIYGSQTGKSMSDIVSPSVCILIAPLLDAQSQPGALKFSGKATDSAGQLAVKKTSNGTGADGGTHTRFKRINVLFADSHVQDMTMIDFHDSAGMKNPDTTNTTVTDLRWNGK